MHTHQIIRTHFNINEVIRKQNTKKSKQNVRHYYVCGCKVCRIRCALLIAHTIAEEKRRKQRQFKYEHIERKTNNKNDGIEEGETKQSE